jgi:hypothetical protein
MNSEIFPNAGAQPLPLEAKIILERYLLTGEVLRWWGKPQFSWWRELRRILPVLGFIMLLFFFMLFLILSQDWNKQNSPTSESESAQQEIKPPQHEEKPSIAGAIFFSAFFSLFLGFWCYMMFRGLGGQKLLNLFSLSRTYYGLTDCRLIMVAGKKEFRVLSYHLRTLQGLRLHEEPDGTGTIHLGPKDRPNNPFLIDDVPPLILKNIPQAAHVFGLIFTAQDKLLRP